MYRYLDIPYFLKKEAIIKSFSTIDNFVDMINVERKFKADAFYECGYKHLPLDLKEHKLFVDYINSHYKSRIKLSEYVPYLITNKKQNLTIHSDIGLGIWSNKERTELDFDRNHTCSINFTFGHYTSRLQYFKPIDNTKIYHLPFHQDDEIKIKEEIPMLNREDAELMEEVVLDTCYPTLVSTNYFHSAKNSLSDIPRCVVSFPLYRPDGSILPFDEACDILKTEFVPEDYKFGMLHDI